MSNMHTNLLHINICYMCPPSYAGYMCPPSYAGYMCPPSYAGLLGHFYGESYTIGNSWGFFNYGCNFGDFFGYFLVGFNNYFMPFPRFLSCHCEWRGLQLINVLEFLYLFGMLCTLDFLGFLAFTYGILVRALNMALVWVPRRGACMVGLSQIHSLVPPKR